MLKKKITYENPFTNQQVSEEHYFHLSKADLVEMEMEEHGAKYDHEGEELTGMRAKLQRIMDSQDGKAILAEFKDIIRRSYGKKDGEKFVKSAEISNDFMGSEAFSQLLFDLCTNPTAGADFMNGIVPGNLDQIAAEIKAEAATSTATQSPTAAGDEQRGHPSDTAAQVPPEPTPAATTPPPPADPDRATIAAERTLPPEQEPRLLTQAEVIEMDSNELKSGLAEGRYKLS